MEQTEVVVIGAGQAGLAISQSVEHVVLERGRIGETWRNRWHSSVSSSRTGPSVYQAAHTMAPIPTVHAARREAVAWGTHVINNCWTW